MYGVALADDGHVEQGSTESLRNEIRGTRKQRLTAPWNDDDHCEHPQNAGDQPWRVGENVELAPGGSDTLRCRRCGEILNGAQGHAAIAQRALRAAGPWMALRYGGDGPNFVLEEVSCASCATLMSVREVRRNGGETKGSS
jgi:hypothetical protein